MSKKVSYWRGGVAFWRSAAGGGVGSSLRTHGLLNLSILQCTPVVVREDHSLSRCLQASLPPLVPPTLSLRCYDASALGASFRPFFRDGESDVFAVLQGGLTGSLGSSWSDGSLYIATVRQQAEAVSAANQKSSSGVYSGSIRNTNLL